MQQRLSNRWKKEKKEGKPYSEMHISRAALLLPEGRSIPHELSCWRSALLLFLPPGLVTSLTFMGSGAEPHSRWPKQLHILALALCTGQICICHPTTFITLPRGLLPWALLGAQGDTVQERNGLARERFPAITHSTARSSQQTLLF